MVSAGGAALRGVGTLLYALDFLCAAGIIGIWSYFIAALVKSNTGVSNTWRAVEGLAGAATLYALMAVLLTCFLGGMKVFAFMGIILDLLFMGAMIAIAVLVRQGVKSCSNNVNTVFGTGAVGNTVPVEWHPTFGTVCKLEKTVFALAVAGAALFLLTALVQFFISAHHQKEKKYGPGPDNGYTSGSGKRTWWHKKTQTVETRFPKDAEAGIVAAPVAAYEPVPRTTVIRPSHDTTYTEATAVGHNNDFGNGTLNKIEHKADRAILPPVVPVDRPASRNAVPIVEHNRSVLPVEAAATPGVASVNDFYPNANEQPVGYSETANPGYYNNLPPVDRSGAEVTRAIYGHDDATGRHF